MKEKQRLRKEGVNLDVENDTSPDGGDNDLEGEDNGLFGSDDDGLDMM